MRILIVEDDLEAAEAMARGLSEAGHDVTRGNDGEEGLVAAPSDFAAIVADAKKAGRTSVLVGVYRNGRTAFLPIKVSG